VFEAFVNSTSPNQKALSDAIRADATHTDVSGFTNLASAFVEQGDKFMPEAVMEALDEAGWSYSSKPDGTILVDVGGFKVPWTTAVRTGEITFS
ncbi:unnamed protein product, partial [Chrysoparadoxa australica]